MANEWRPFPCDTGDRFDYECCGQEVQVEHIKAYVCKPLASMDNAVIVIQDVFGWQLPNMRHMADIVAANGYIAICPDIFAGKEAWKPSDDWSNLDDCLKAQDPRKINKEADAILKYLKEQCGAKRLGVIGFCWGGVAVHHMMLTYPKLRAGVSLYGLIKDSDVSNLLNPTFFIFAEKMTSFPFIKYVTPLEQKLKQNSQADYQVKIYPGQTHGFVYHRREDINPKDKPYIEEERKDIINWLNKYI
uniref:Carboxymethylenebutenolidase homolog n=1 Tax=Anser brachyrhynchus TaxID=132585 RepID=A0A8B9ICE9_9AVES